MAVVFDSTPPAPSRRIVYTDSAPAAPVAPAPVSSGGMRRDDVDRLLEGQSSGMSFPADAELRAYNPTILDRTRNFLRPLTEIVHALGTPPPSLPQIPRLESNGNEPLLQEIPGGIPVPTPAMGRAILNTGIDLVNTLPTPIGAGMLMGGLPARLAGAALSPVMAQTAADNFKPTVQTVQNPNVSPQAKAEAVLAEGLLGLGAFAPVAGVGKGVYGVFDRSRIKQTSDLGTITPDILPPEGQAPRPTPPPQPVSPVAGAKMVEPIMPKPTDISPTELAFVGRAQSQASGDALLAKTAGVSPQDLSIRQLATRMVGKTPEQAVKALREEIRLIEDPDMKKILVDEADRLDNYIIEQDKILDAQKKQQEALDAQQAAQDVQAKAADRQLAEQEKALKEQQSAIAEQQKAQEQAAQEQLKVQEEAAKATQALTNPEPMNMANTGAQVAKNIEDQPATAQGQLNAITQAPQQPQQQLAQPEPVAQLAQPATQLPQSSPVTKEASILAAVKTPGVQWQYTVQRPMVPGGKGFIQIDAIKGDQNLTSSNLADLNKAGAKLPDVPEWVPQGQYSLEQLKELIKQGEPKETIVSAAIRTTDGKIIQGRVHAGAFNEAEDMGLRVGANAEDEGFVTSKGRYVTREEAAKIASDAGQTDRAFPRIGAEDVDLPNSKKGLLAEDLPAEARTEVEQILESTPNAGSPPPDNKQARRAGATRRQQRGAATSDVLGSVGGAATGAAYGFVSTKKEEGESEEHFQTRRLLRSLFFFGGGGMAGGSVARLALRSPASRRVEALSKIQGEALGRDSMPQWYRDLSRADIGPTIFGNKLTPLRLRQAINNSRAIVKDAVAEASEAGHEIPDQANPFAAGKTYGPKVSEAKRKAALVMDDVQKAIVEAGKKSPQGVENFITQFNAWLEARHTPFYNLHLDDLHQLSGSPGAAPTSRLTDQEAFAVLQKAQQDGLEPVFENLADGYRAIIKSTRDVLEQGGLITPETRKAWEQKFPEYVPMNRIPEDADLDSALVGYLGGGPGLSVLNSGVKRIKGSNLDVSDIGGNLMANWNDAITRVQKNEVQKAAGYFFKNMEFDGTPVPGVEVRKPKVIGTGAGDKPIMEQFDPNHMVSYMVNGKPNWIVFNDPKMALAFSNLNVDGLQGIMRVLGAPTRMMARAFTGYNLDFLVPNVLRDRQSAAWKAATQGDFAGALQQINPTKIAGDPAIVSQWVFDKKTPDTQMFQQMMDDGGMPGGYASSTRAQAQEFVEGLRRADTNPAAWTVQQTKKAFNFLSEISEGATRFRAYKRALELGASRQEAAVAALNSSVDFNMKGTKTNQLGALYAFFNPAQQGAVNMAKNVFRSKDAMVALMTGLMGLNAATDSWNSSIDPQWKSRNAFQFARTNGIPLIYGVDPQTKELKYFTIPIAQDLRAIKAISDFALEMGNGQIKSGDNLQSELARVGGSIVNSVNPLGASPLESPLNTIAPTVVRPLIDIETNRDYANRPIVPDEKNIDRFIQDQAKRNLSSYDSRTGRMAISLADTLKENFGMEVSPERMKYLMNAYTGGPGKLVSSAINAPEASSAEFKASNLPVAGSFVRRASSEGLEKKSPLYQKTIQELSDAKTADELVRQKARLFYNKTFDKIPPQRWGEFWRAADKQGLMPRDIVFRRSVISQLTDKLKGRGDIDKLVAEFAIENGERAAYYAERKADFKTEKEYLQYLDGQRKKGLLTAPMVPQIQMYLQKK